MDAVKQFFMDVWAVGLVRFIVYIALGIIAGAVANLIVSLLLKLVKLDKWLDRVGVNEGRSGTSLSFIGKIVFLIVFMLFLPSAFNALGLVEVSNPIMSMMHEFVGYLPNIVAAVILLYVGIMIAGIIGQIVAVLLRKTKIDRFTARKDENANTVRLSDVIAKIIVAVIVLITIVQALTVLDISAISVPALGIINSIFDAIPAIILAAVVISCGILVTNIACNLLSNVLVGVNFDEIVKKMIPQIKVSATKVVVGIVRTLIIIFVAAQGVEALGLSILTAVVATVVSYLPLVIKSAIVALVAFVGAYMLETFIVKANPKATCLAKIVKTGIYVLAGFMILSQLDIASTIVNTAFVVALAAVAVAFALAFGLGGKDFAKKTLDKVDEKIEKDGKAE